MGKERTTKRLWQAWLRTDNGGYLGIPYPAADEDRAQELAHKAEKCFNGTLLAFWEIK